MELTLRALLIKSNDAYFFYFVFWLGVMKASNTIALLTPDLRGGGVERIRLTLAKEFRSLGYDVEFVLAQARGDLLEEAKRDFPVVDLACNRMRSVPVALRRYLRTRKPAVLCSAMWPLTAIAPLAALNTGTRVVVSEHGILSAQYRSWGSTHRLGLRSSTAAGYRMAHERVGVSSGVARDMAKLSGMPVNRFRVINNPIPPSAATTPDELAKASAFWSVPKGGRIITVGTLKKVKNHELLLRAFSMMATAGTEVLLLGDGELRSELQELSNQLGVADRVIFAGFHSDPTAFYQTADLFVLSSDFEGFGNVIVESLASGTPVVSTNCPAGPAEILEDGRWGELTPVGDAPALAAAMDASLARQHDEEALRKRARDFLPSFAANHYLDAFGLL
ncbi:glycosyltransferase [Rhodopirellula europaea]|uniref:Glycosyl transferase, group 1 family protein n=1 Tax=Rhodopirellula europaea 6C TaxID=1263867 RepID=M2B7P3_9BACT|nr:glycosyltransferase [Rhodopirellula europaea]EMB17748.1 glycosyl transferase, group 1 family protein [Rhodopirellula europaea 6C]